MGKPETAKGGLGLAFEWPCDRKLIADPDEKIVRHEAQNLDKETAHIKNLSTQAEWAPTGKTLAIIALIIAVIAIISDFFSK